MDFDFSSKEELYIRVKPALKAKVKEMERFGFTVSIVDIWNYLIIHKWKNGVGLMLSDIVDDILNTNNIEIITYMEENKNKKEMHSINEQIDII